MLYDSNVADILVVDDTPANLKFLSSILRQAGYSVRQALSGEMALIAIKTKIPDLVLLDIMMPDIDGYQVCKRIKSYDKTMHLPIIFLSALSDAFNKIQAFEVGGSDYITKPFFVEEVLARVQVQLAASTAQRRIQHLNTQLEQRVLQRTAALAQANQTLELEIQERRDLQKQLEFLANHDDLTLLPNRRAFLQALARDFHRVRQDQSYELAILFFDCDRFKLINDSLGHLVGDQLLVALSQRIQTILQDFDCESVIFSRLGGDEFAILLTHHHIRETVNDLSKNLLESLKNPFTIDRFELYTDISIGIAVDCASYQKSENLMRDADTAMYQAKKLGRGCHVYFEGLMYQAASTALQLEIELRNAIQSHQLDVYYQPIIDLKSHQFVGCEALVRWHHPQQGFIRPDLFIPVAEETGMIGDLGLQVLQKACDQIAVWGQVDGVPPRLWVSVNLSPQQLMNRDFLAQLDSILMRSKIQPQCLKLEVTESVAIHNLKSCCEQLQSIRDRHIQICLDDFGTGYSSLSYLHSLPLTVIKIDRSFTARMLSQSRDRDLVAMIVKIAHSLDMQTVAEGVETHEQVSYLQSIHCDFAQGYFFSRPAPASEITTLLQGKLG
jgi:diguanylate cyclase (GGDEF)-like protein